MATKAEVKDRSLELLGVKTIGQGADNKDITRIGTAYTEVYADLKSEGLATWATAGIIPDDVAPHLIALMAFNAIDDYGVSNARYKRIVVRVGLAKPEIRRLTIPDFESLEEPADY